MTYLIKKSTNEFEEFDEQKLRRSLLAPGAPGYVVDEIINYIKHNLNSFKSTQDIFNYALDRLLEEHPHIASRYNLKKALLQFGPTGFPFEKFAAEIFKKMKYEIQLDQIVRGWCVDHEVDIILKKHNESALVECKFHNEQNYRTDVQVTLYTQARYLDIEKDWKSTILTNSWVVTNTKFTYEALKYGNCKQMKLLSWNYPKDNNLAHLIDNYGLYPITVLVSLTMHQKKFLVNHGFVLCSQAKQNIDLLKSAGITGNKLDKIIHECELISQTGKDNIDL